MSHTRKPQQNFKILIYTSEFQQLQSWTDKHQHVETGGDLFGLWKDDCTAVIQFVVGPGKRCRRTSTSFYQDLDYLKSIGELLTKTNGLCHIGEWNSHHRLGLSVPSEGDVRTVWTNMDRYGISRFFLLIANIEVGWLSSLRSKQGVVNVNGFLFEIDPTCNRRLPVIKGEFVFLEEDSPFRSISNEIKGEENTNTEQEQQKYVVNRQQMELEIQRRKEAERRIVVLQKVSTQEKEIREELKASMDEEKKAHTATEKQLHNSKQRSLELEPSLAAERQTREKLERRLHNNEKRLIELEKSLAAERQTREKLERRLNDSGQTSNELETTPHSAQQDNEEYGRSKKPSCDWILNPNEICLSDTVIREGTWGKVFEGTFRCRKVAVKKISQPVLSSENTSLFEREMTISSKCRHPCLLQFIGATNDQSPLFVTELLDTSLEAVLTECLLEPTHIKTIALDVAKGLNFLHLHQPFPIIHQDISSANVLLWKHGRDWRAKVSEYGTANFLKKAMEVCLGPDIYSAPEASEPIGQSPKVDVYSFGVLLWEMIIREKPKVEHKYDSRVSRYVRCLIRKCLSKVPKCRYSMTEIIRELELIADSEFSVKTP